MSKLKISKQLTEKLTSADSIVFFTGAGISAESGIATFRGDDGLWKRFKPSELANMGAFMKNPSMVWDWYQYRRKIIEETTPNVAHIAITRMADYFNSVVVVTQNVDNLHRRAGNPLVYELHGNIEKNYCMKCKKRYDFISFENTGSVPKCSCGGLIRPDVVWFGEMLPESEYEAAENAMSGCDIVFSVGTSAVVYPAASLPMLAYQGGAYLVEINPERTEQSNFFNESLRAGAGEALTVILNEVQSIRQHKK